MKYSSPKDDAVSRGNIDQHEHKIIVGNQAITYTTIQELTFAIILPMAIVGSFVLAVIDPNQRDTFSNIATVGFGSSASVLLSKSKNKPDPFQNR